MSPAGRRPHRQSSRRTGAQEPKRGFVASGTPRYSDRVARRPGYPRRPATPMSERAAKNLLIRIDPRARAGLQQQLYSGIRRAIVEGVVAPGTRLPSSRALAEDLGVSRMTAVLALDQLRAEGYLAVRRTSGTFVVKDLPDAVPGPRPAPPPDVPRHPPVSARAASVAAVPPAALRAGVAPRPFRIGVPALDLFPVRTWSAIAGRRLRSVTATQLDYGATSGLRALREAIADHVSSARGTRCEARQVFVLAGAQGALELVADLLLDPGEPAWSEEPGYPGARKALLSAGARVIPVPVDAEGLDVDAGRRLAPAARLAIVTPSHQFPLGVPMSLARRTALLRWASEAGAWVVEDDYDSEFRHGSRPVPCVHGLDPDGRVVYIGSFSKTLFPSLRMGFAIVPADLQDTVFQMRRSTDHAPPTLDQATLAEFIADGHYDRHLRRMRVVYTERLEALEDAARRFCGGVLRVRQVSTGLHVVADLEGADDTRVFAEAAARGVETMPLSSYYSGEGKRARERPRARLRRGAGRRHGRRDGAPRGRRRGGPARLRPKAAYGERRGRAARRRDTRLRRVRDAQPGGAGWPPPHARASPSRAPQQPSFLKKSFPLSSTRMKAGKSTTSIFQTASIPSSGKSMHSTFLMFSSASTAAGPPMEPR